MLRFTNEAPVIAFFDNTVSTVFTKTEWKFSCFNQYRYTYNQSYADFSSNTPYYIIINNATNNGNSNNNSVPVTVQSVHKKIQPTQNATTCPPGQ